MALNINQSLNQGLWCKNRQWNYIAYVNTKCGVAVTVCKVKPHGQVHMLICYLQNL